LPVRPGAGPDGPSMGAKLSSSPCCPSESFEFGQAAAEPSLPEEAPGRGNRDRRPERPHPSPDHPSRPPRIADSPRWDNTTTTPSSRSAAAASSPQATRGEPRARWRGRSGGMTTVAIQPPTVGARDEEEDRVEALLQELHFEHKAREEAEARALEEEQRRRR